MTNLSWLKVKKLSKNAKIPTYGHEGDACFDLYALENYTVRPGEVLLIRTGLAMAISEGYEMQVRPRSGLSLKGLIIPNSPCTIDAGYRGEIKTPMANVSDKATTIRAGDRYAQATIKPIWRVIFQEVDDLPDSERGEGGFGSTGSR
jgi:dUTP pyrophosphatase